MLALCLLFGSLVACGGQPAADSTKAVVQRLLDTRATAVLRHDETAYTRRCRIELTIRDGKVAGYEMRLVG